MISPLREKYTHTVNNLHTSESVHIIHTAFMQHMHLEVLECHTM